MIHRFHIFPDLTLFFVSVLVQYLLTKIVLARPGWRSRGRLGLLLFGNLLLAGIFAAGYLTSFQRTWRYLPSVFGEWLEASGMILAVTLAGLYLGILVWRSALHFEPPRRTFLKAAAASLIAAPAMGIAIGAANRHKIRLSEVDVAIPNLPKDLDGLRLVQITDIHLSPFFSEKDLARAVDMANETHANIALVTGDLISRIGDPLDACLRQLAHLRADAGVLGCLGNHEIYTRTEAYVTEQGKRNGIEFLRNETRLLKFGAASLNVAGVDYQRFHTPYLVGAEKLVSADNVNILLSHNSDVFPVAVKQGYDLTIAGHTHGGQVNFEILHQNVDVALYFTKFVRGLYRQGGKSLYVCSGLGTIGVPVRLGAPPEVSVIRLCAS